MNVTRHISIDDEYIEKLKPYMEKHSGNLGAAIKEMIILAGKYSPRGNSSAIDVSFFDWMLSELDGILVPANVLDELIDPMLFRSMRIFEEHMKQRFIELGWDIEFELKYDSDTSPSLVSMELKGGSQKIKFAARLLSQYLVKNSLDQAPLEIRLAVYLSDCMKVELARSNKKDAQNSLITFFGGNDETIRSIRARPDFWRSIINRHISNNYNMVTIHRNYFEDLLANNLPLGEILIESLAKKPLREIPLNEMLSLIKVVYEESRVVDNVDIDNDAIVLSHSYRNKEAIEKLKKILVGLLEANGHLYDAKSTANMIVLKHRPDVGSKINEMVDNLKTSNSRVDQELIMFMAFVSGLKDIPDIPISMTAFGKRIGKSLMQEYEKENSIKGWDLENFQKALEIIDSKLHRESEWKLEGKNLLYTVRKCNIVAEDRAFDIYVCHTARETFKGALSYAFGNRAQLNIKHLLTHGDNFCEVVIRLP
jgi:predicted hydrocarbon binding protein